VGEGVNVVVVWGHKEVPSLELLSGRAWKREGRRRSWEQRSLPFPNDRGVNKYSPLDQPGGGGNTYYYYRKDTRPL